MTKGNTFHWIVYLYCSRYIFNNEIFQKRYTSSYQIKIRIYTNWYFLQYNLQSIVKKSQIQLSTNLSSTNSVIHKSFQLSTILRRTTIFRHTAWNSTTFQFNILFQSLLFLHSNREKKKKKKKLVKKKEVNIK